MIAGQAERSTLGAAADEQLRRRRERERAYLRAKDRQRQNVLAALRALQSTGGQRAPAPLGEG